LWLRILAVQFSWCVPWNWEDFHGIVAADLGRAVFVKSSQSLL
jgi:hypothetical protein